jgi:hypothetical protein
MTHKLSRWRWSSALLTLGAVLAATPTPAQEPIPQRIRIDLGSGATRSSLPFDEPIVVVGPADSLVVGMRLRYRDAQSLGSAFSSEAAPERVCEGSATWTAAPVWRRRPGIPSDTFSLLLPGLPGERLFVFCMVPLLRPGAETAEKTRQQLAAAMDVALRDTTLRDHTLAQQDSVRRAIVALLKPVPGTTLEIASGSLFSDVPTNEARAQLLQIVRITAQNTQRQLTIQRLDTGLKSTGDTLGLLMADSLAFRSMAALLRNRQWAGPKNDAGGACALPAARFFAVPREGTIAQVASGDGTLADIEAGPPVRLSTIRDSWNPTDVAPRLERLARTQECLGGLRAMAASLVSSKALRDSAGIDDVAARRLVGRIDAAREEVAGIQGNMFSLHAALEQRAARLREAAATVTRLSEVHAPVVGSTQAVSFDARARRYISMDLGVLHAPHGDITAAYYGASLTACPVNKRVRLPPLFSGPGWLCKRLSLVAGLTATSVAKADERENLFGSSAGVVGVGVRVLDFFRVTAGGLILRDLGGTAAQPTSDIATAPFVSLSFDLDVRQLFTDLSTLITR